MAAFPGRGGITNRPPPASLKKVPGKYREMAISDAVAKTMIELIRAGRPLPPEFVADLWVVF